MDGFASILIAVLLPSGVLAQSFRPAWTDLFCEEHPAIQGRRSGQHVPDPSLDRLEVRCHFLSCIIALAYLRLVELKLEDAGIHMTTRNGRWS